LLVILCLPFAGPILNNRAEREDAAGALRRVGLDLHPDTPLSHLTAGEKTLVAVARVFDRGARILIVDETTSTLPPADAKRVMASLGAADP
jgi:ribose transport system ATP-binding protein